MKNEENISNQDHEFEKQLWNAFKNFGYLFPSTDKEVESFEKLFDTTETEIPKEIKNPEYVTCKIKESKNEFNPYTKAAAFTKKSKPNFNSDEMKS